MLPSAMRVNLLETQCQRVEGGFAAVPRFYFCPICLDGYFPGLWVNFWTRWLARLWATARFFKSLPHFSGGRVALRRSKMGNPDTFGSERRGAGEQILKPSAPGIT